MKSFPLLELKNVTKVYSVGGALFFRGTIVAVEDISFEIGRDKATILGIVGESGSGKSTIARLILGLIKPTLGEIIYDGKNIQTMNKNEKKIYRKEVQPVFQDPYSIFNPFYKVDRILESPIKKFKVASSHSEMKKLINESLETVNLFPSDVLGKYPHELSGGQRQRVMVSRAFLLKPRIIIADEPVSMIDASVRAGILNIMLNLKREYNISFVLISHDMSVASYICENLVVLYRGSIMESGNINELIHNPLHPYLHLLLSSIPTTNPKERWKESVVIDSKNLITLEKYSGCKFSSRCPRAKEECSKETPPLLNVNDNHKVACRFIKG